LTTIWQKSKPRQKTNGQKFDQYMNKIKLIFYKYTDAYEKVLMIGMIWQGFCLFRSGYLFLNE